MQLIVANRYIKQFAKTIQCLAKIGEDLYLCATEENIKFITVNAPKSTFVELKIAYPFLESYQDVESCFGLQFKIRAKQCYQMFSSTKNIDKCCINVNQETCQINFHMLCKNNIHKCYKVNCEIATCANALYSKDTTHQLQVKSKTINECLSYFANNLEEISFQILKDRFVLKSYLDSAKKGTSKMLQTEITIDYADFDHYATDGSGTEISFAFKDTKTFMAYCDTMQTPVDMFFSNIGDPFLMHVKLTQNFEIDFVIATLITHNNSQTSSQSSNNNNNNNNTSSYAGADGTSPSATYQKGSYTGTNTNNFSPYQSQQSPKGVVSQGGGRSQTSNSSFQQNQHQSSNHSDFGYSDHYNDKDDYGGAGDFGYHEPMDHDSFDNQHQPQHQNHSQNNNSSMNISINQQTGDLSNAIQPSPINSQSHTPSSSNRQRVSYRRQVLGKPDIEEDDDDELMNMDPNQLMQMDNDQMNDDNSGSF